MLKVLRNAHAQLFIVSGVLPFMRFGKDAKTRLNVRQLPIQKLKNFKHAGSIELDAVKFHLVHVHVFAKPNFLLQHQNCSFER